MKAKWKAVAASIAAAVGLAGCASLDMGYYWQSASGHMAMLNAARPVPEWVGAEQASQKLRDRLALSQQIRRFASSELMLPDNSSYTRYADLGRSAAVWNVVGAPELSLKLKTWCFPVVGCVGYRGYFNEESARAEAERLRAQGLEATVYPVPAYSTLGWMNWAGGDPLLNTFINYPEGELARLIFHELAHQVLYVSGDTTFNESFATAVERLGVARYMASPATQAAPQEYAEFRAEYARLREGWGGDPARFKNSDRWVAEANNASFGAQAAYDELVPGFEALFEREGRDWRRFYEAARRMGELPKTERHKRLKALAEG